MTFTYGDTMHPSAVTSISSGKTYSYDANGNMATGGGRDFTWNIDNRVTSVTLGGSTTSMEYDYTGARVKKDGAGGQTLYPFAGYEIAPDGTVTKFIRIGSENFASKKRTGTADPTWYFYHNDHLGGVNVITDINGGRVQLNEYDPWGGVSRSEGTIDPDTRFTGQKLDAETGLYYYGGRYYDPEISRFISPDPFVQDPDDPQNLNRYSYVLNDPINYTDPSGYFYMGKGIADGPFGTGIAGQIFGYILGALFTWATGNPMIGMVATWMIDIAQNPNAALSGGSIANVISSVITAGLFGGSGPRPFSDSGGSGGLGNWAWLMARPSKAFEREGASHPSLMPPPPNTNPGTSGFFRRTPAGDDFPSDDNGDTRLAFQIQDRGHGQRERQRAAEALKATMQSENQTMRDPRCRDCPPKKYCTMHGQGFCNEQGEYLPRKAPDGLEEKVNRGNLETLKWIFREFLRHRSVKDAVE